MFSEVHDENCGSLECQVLLFGKHIAGAGCSEILVCLYCITCQETVIKLNQFCIIAFQADFQITVNILPKYGNAFVAFENSFHRTSVTTFVELQLPHFVELQ
jgi:hypothetical protein